MSFLVTKMKYKELKNSLKVKTQNAYVIWGEDRYLCFDALEKIENSISISMPSLNKVVISGEDVSAKEIVESANVYPFVDTIRLIEVKSFLDLVPKKGNSAENQKLSKEQKNKIDSELEILQNYLNNPLSSTVLVFFNPDGGEYIKKLKNITDIDCNKLEDNLISDFIKSRLAKNGISSNQEAIDTLILYSLGNMTKVTNELEKLIAYVDESKILTSDIIKNYVAQDYEFQVFELSEFLAKGNSSAVFQFLDNFENGAKQNIGFLPILYNHFRRALYVAVNKKYKSQSELADLLGVKPYAIKVMMGQIEKFSTNDLLNITQMIYKFDKKVKNGEIKENIAINLIATSILKTRG